MLREVVTLAVIGLGVVAVFAILVTAATIGTTMSSEESKGDGATQSGPLVATPAGTKLPLVGPEKIMSKKEYGTCVGPLQPKIRWGCDREVCMEAREAAVWP